MEPPEEAVGVRWENQGRNSGAVFLLSTHPAPLPVARSAHVLAAHGACGTISWKMPPVYSLTHTHTHTHTHTRLQPKEHRSDTTSQGTK